MAVEVGLRPFGRAQGMAEYVWEQNLRCCTFCPLKQQTSSVHLAAVRDIRERGVNSGAMHSPACGLRTVKNVTSGQLTDLLRILARMSSSLLCCPR